MRSPLFVGETARIKTLVSLSIGVMLWQCYVAVLLTVEAMLTMVYMVTEIEINRIKSSFSGQFYLALQAITAKFLQHYWRGSTICKCHF